MKKRRVVITGLGIVAPNGTGKDEYWKTLQEARSWVGPITRFDASAYPSSVAAEATHFRPADFLPQRLVRKTDRFTHFALAATELALGDARLDFQSLDTDRVGIVIGNCLGGWEFAERELRDLYVSGPNDVSPYQATAWFPAAPQGQISIFYGITGHSKTVVADRASGVAAVGYGMRAIRDGVAEIVLAGGCEAPISPYSLLCCNTMGLLACHDGRADPETLFRPYDLRRAGFVLGEGAGMVVLEELEHARARGAQVYAEVSGYSMTSDGYCHVRHAPDGRSSARALKQALAGAGVSAEEVDYFCADGAGTPLGDRIETQVIKEVFGEHAHRLPVSAPKSMIGNLLGAAGAIDVITTVLAMQSSQIPPTINYEVPDPECDLDYVPNVPICREVRAALVNARGLGGVNTALVLKAPEPNPRTLPS